MPSPHEKRSMVLSMLKNTFMKVAEKDNTISRRKLINEIVEKFEVSMRTAQSYIQELIDMKMVKESDDMLWHSQEQQIRTDYLMNKDGTR